VEKVRNKLAKWASRELKMAMLLKATFWRVLASRLNDFQEVS
jgi:hypothetical protein